MKNKSLIESFNNAVSGIIVALRLEKNMRIHILAAFTVLLISIFTKLTKLEILILISTISLVVITELINTAVEKIVDIATEKYHPLAKVAKDAAAGAVFISALNSIVVGYIIFFEKLNLTTYEVILKVQQTPVHLMFIAISIVLITIISLKAYFNKGTPFHGGMPSGHSALAFAVATSISFISKEISVIVLCMLLAMLVAQSRIEGKIHNAYEVVAGAAIGIILTLLIFQFAK